MIEEWMESEFEQRYEHAESILRCALINAAENGEPVDRVAIAEALGLLNSLMDAIDAEADES